MKVSSSKFLKDNKAFLKKLLDAALDSFEYASILAVDSEATDYRVSRVNTVIQESKLLSQRGFVIKAYDGQCYGEYSFNEISDDEISEEKIPEIIAALKEKVYEIYSEDLLEEGITLSKYKQLSDEEIVFSEATDYEISPIEAGDEEIIKRLTHIMDLGLARDDKIMNCNVSLSYQKYTKYFISKNRDMEQSVMWTNGSINVSVKRNQEVKFAYRGFSNLGGLEVLDSMKNAVNEVADMAVELLDAEPIKPGLYDCICTPGVTGMIVHEAFGHGVEMDMFVKDRALASSYIGKPVASEIVTMHDGASKAAALESATYFFDDEGIIATDTVVIKNGILMSGISDAQSAMALGTEPTGNGRRESYKRKAYTRMTNTYFEAGNDKVSDMIASIEYGFLLDDALSGMEDPKNWGIQMMVNVAREIKDGKLTGKIFSPIILTGYVPDLLKSISMMSDEKELCGSGFCGKGYKEWVKVSDGGPYIKAKVRLG